MIIQRLLRVLLVAAEKEMLAGHLQAVRLAGLRPEGIDPNPIALLRSLGPVAGFGEGAEALVDVGARFTQRLEVFVDQVRGSLDFYRSQQDAVPLARVVGSGGGSLLGPLVERLQAVTGVPTGRGRTLAGVIGLLGLVLAAAQAGVDDYLYRLQQDDEYVQDSATSPPTGQRGLHRLAGPPRAGRRRVPRPQSGYYSDPATAPSRCSEYWWQGRSTSYCVRISFVTGDTINGPPHINDTIGVNDNPGSTARPPPPTPTR